MKDLYDQLKTQRMQETQLTNELEAFLDRMCEEYALTRFQVAAALEQQKLRILMFTQKGND